MPSTAGDPAKLAIGPDDHIFFTTNLSSAHPGHAAEMTGEYVPQSHSTVVYLQGAQALTTTPNGDLYTVGGDQGSGLARMPAATRSAALLQHGVPSFEHATVPLTIADRSLAADGRGRVWMAIANEPQIAVFDPGSGKLQVFRYPVQSPTQYTSHPDMPGVPSSPPPGAIRITPIAAMMTDDQGHLWFIRDLSDQVEEVAA